MATSDTTRTPAPAQSAPAAQTAQSAQTAQAGPQVPRRQLPSQHRPHLPADAREHPREAWTAVVVLGLGVAAVVCGLVDGWHFAGSATGLLGVALGLWDQYLSATRAERMVIIPGLVAAGVGLGLSLAHGGFSV